MAVGCQSAKSDRQLAAIERGAVACVRFMTRGHGVSRIQSRRLPGAISELW